MKLTMNLLLTVALTVSMVCPVMGQQPTITLKWLEGDAPKTREGVSWGVPWAKGALPRNASVSLRGSDGSSIPVQTWPLAYWPDGSIKWSGHAISTTPGMAGELRMSAGQAAAPATALTATDSPTVIDVNTGTMRARILKSGSNLFESLTIGDKQVASGAKLIMTLEDRSRQEGEGVIRHEQFVSRIDKVTLEQSGPMRAVVKIEGMHKATKSDKAMFPFVVRFYFSAGTESMRIVHSFIYDGVPAQDFIKGIGLSFSVPFKEQVHNRHVRFVGDGTEGGVWVQPVKLLPGYRNNFLGDDYAKHLAGKRIQDYGENPPEQVASVPIWNDMKLTQLGPDSFSIDKRTQSQSSWLHVNNGNRSLGMAVLAEVSGGIAVGLKDFWQKYPSTLEISNAASDVGELKVWLWSPEGEAADMRHYDIQGHALPTNYEDWKPGWDNAYGVANTADLTLWAFAEIPSNADLYNMAKSAAAPPLLICTPQYYHEQKAFGYWSLPDNSTPAKKWVEDQVEYLYEYYHQQVAERRWYGFWDYGDIMHNYDFGRHEWRYDVGGWAWNNSELAPDMFLYYMFLRTGRADIFRMAEAMTRHTSEVDVHHIGVFSPLGSRHNVKHWGDGAKQPRISQSGFKRFYYYLTTDDRTGDLMRDQLDADLAYNRVRAMDTSRVPIGVVAGNLTTPWTGEDMVARGLSGRGGRGGGRAGRGPVTAPAGEANAGARRGGGRRGGRGDAERPPQFYADGRPMEPRFTNVSFGLDWICYAINWTTEWERTGNTDWRDRVLAGMKSIIASGQSTTGTFDIIFGGAEDMAQMDNMYDYPEFWNFWTGVCEAASTVNGNAMTGPRMAAFAAYYKKDATLGARAWQNLIGNADFRQPFQPGPVIKGPDVLNPTTDPVFLGRSAGWQLHGPASIQWALNALETMELAKDYLAAWERERIQALNQ